MNKQNQKETFGFLLLVLFLFSLISCFVLLPFNIAFQVFFYLLFYNLCFAFFFFFLFDFYNADE